MFRSIIICPDRRVRERLVQALQATDAVAILRNMDSYPAAQDLLRTVRAQAAEVLFLSFEDSAKALQVVQLLEGEASNIHIVAVHRTMDPQVLRETMRAGVREFLVDPFEKAALWDSLGHVKDLVERSPARYQATNQVFTFLPSKAGVGTTTTALNVSAAMARGKKLSVLLSDFDLNSGMTRFMLKLENPHSVPEAVERVNELDEVLWPQLVTSFQGLDVLHAGKVNPHLRIGPEQVSTLTAFMRRNYQAVCFDMSGNLERYSVELMQESKRILLVCTPEVPSLHLAREKMSFLRECGLQPRVSVILNRVHKKTVVSAKEVAEMVGAPVIRSFPNDYQGVERAVTNGTLVESNSALGKAYAEFAGFLITDHQPVPEKSGFKRKYLELVPVPAQATFGRD